MTEYLRTPASHLCEQVFLLDRDAGLMCRILGLYAARGLDVQQVDYAHAAQAVMTLRVRVQAPAPEREALSEGLRVLVDKAASLVGVIAAVAHDAPPERPSPQPPRRPELADAVDR